jgi:hypothetical protein
VTPEPAEPPLVGPVVDPDPVEVVAMVPVEGLLGESLSPHVTAASEVSTKASPPNNCKFRFMRGLRG